jgi:D-glycero-alpha-D-manno-heptose-7-phosphate kinase
MIITKTPYRISLFGGGTDYPAWFENKPSRVVSAAIANYCYFTVKVLPPFFEHKNQVVYSKIESVNTFSEINHPSVKACLKYMNIPNGISIAYDGDLPARSGIGSSSSFTVGLLHALHVLKGEEVSRERLSREAIFVEQNLIGENVGIQDQIMAAHGGIRLIEMGPGEYWQSSALPLSYDYRKELENYIMIGFSGVSRISESVSKKQVENIKKGTIESFLNHILDLSNKAIDCLVKESDMKTIGGLLHDGWSLKRELADGVTEPWIDDIYHNSIKCGSLGGKLMGAGGGGFFMFLVPPEKQKEFKYRMKSIKVWIPFKFDTDGTQLVLKS